MTSEQEKQRNIEKRKAEYTPYQVIMSAVNTMQLLKYGAINLFDYGGEELAEIASFTDYVMKGIVHRELKRRDLRIAYEIPIGKREVSDKKNIGNFLSMALTDSSFPRVQVDGYELAQDEQSVTRQKSTIFGYAIETKTFKDPSRSPTRRIIIE